MVKERLGMIKEFKEFALKGNAVTLAIGVVMGAAFNAIVTSIVSGMINPLIALMARTDELGNAKFTVGNTEFMWGSVVGAIINFLAVALVLFIVVKFIARLSEEPDPTTHPCPYCTTEIANEATRCPACTSEVEPFTPTVTVTEATD